jgi:hypothetical protein
MNVRYSHIVIALAALLSATPAAYAQLNGPAPLAGKLLTPIQIGVACAAPPFLAAPRPAVLRVIGAQDTVSRSLYGTADLLVISGGTKAGVLLGQRFFVRRPVTFGNNSPGDAHAILTSGWIRIVAVNDTTSIAAVDFVCGDISQDDYLEPFVVPTVPDDANRNDPSGELNFADLAHVLFRSEEYRTGAAGDFMLIDRGSDQDTVLGSRFAVFRDLQSGGLPLTSVAEGIVVSVGKRMSVMRITASRDAVQAGDFVVPRRH